MKNALYSYKISLIIAKIAIILKYRHIPKNPENPRLTFFNTVISRFANLGNILKILRYNSRTHFTSNKATAERQSTAVLTYDRKQSPTSYVNEIYCPVLLHFLCLFLFKFSTVYLSVTLQAYKYYLCSFIQIRACHSAPASTQARLRNRELHARYGQTTRTRTLWSLCEDNQIIHCWHVHNRAAPQFTIQVMLHLRLFVVACDIALL